MATVAAARYGKDNVRVCKVDRNAETGVQTVTEMTVCVLLEGDIATSCAYCLLKPAFHTDASQIHTSR